MGMYPEIYVTCDVDGKTVEAYLPLEHINSVDDLKECCVEAVGEAWNIDGVDGCGDMIDVDAPLTCFVEVAQVFESLDRCEENWEAFVKYAENCNCIPSVENFRDAYQGAWREAAEWAEEFINEVYGSEVPDALDGFIDYEKWARHAASCGDIFLEDTDDGRVIVFRNV